jgi:hypothetical protein
MPDGSTVPVSTTELRYHADDPFAVRAAFCAGGGRLRPTRRQGQHMVRITLTSPAGRAELVVPTTVTAAFLRPPDAMVPPGTEHGPLDLDAELSDLLTGH